MSRRCRRTTTALRFASTATRFRVFLCRCWDDDDHHQNVLLPLRVDVFFFFFFFPNVVPKGKKKRRVLDVVVRDGRRAMETASTGPIETPGARAQRHPTHEEMARFGRVTKAPIDWISEVQPIGVNGSKVNCHSPGACKEVGEGAALGAPATFYTLADTSVENPAKCKYCGLRFYSLEGSH